MVMRYTGEDCMSWPDGEWVAYEDYQSLQAALREALKGWEGCHVQEELERIEYLKKQFLDI